VSPWFLVTVIGRRGSTSGKIGVKMIVKHNGNMVETIGGGDIEDIVNKKAAEVLKQEEIDTREVMKDQVHIFLSAPPRYSPARIVQIMRHISQASS